jgi:carbonic anhydrase
MGRPHPEFAMTKSVTDQLLENNRRYADGHAVHQPVHPGKQPIQPSRRVAVVGCMDARLDVEDLLGLQTGEAHIIRNAGGVVTEDAIRCLIISHHLLNTNEIILIHHTRCGMLAFTDDLLKAGLEGDPAAVKLLGQATGREFVCCGRRFVQPRGVPCLPRRARAAGCAARCEEHRAAGVGRAPRHLDDPEPPVDPDQRGPTP